MRLDRRGELLQVVQEAFAKEQDLLPVGLQPQGYGSGPRDPLSQRLEQVSSGLVTLEPVAISPGVTPFFYVQVVLIHTSVRSGNNRPFLERKSISMLPAPGCEC